MRECGLGPLGRKGSSRHRHLRKDSSRRAAGRIAAFPRTDNDLPQRSPGVLYCHAGRVNHSYPHGRGNRLKHDRQSDEKVLDYRNPRTTRSRLRWRRFVVIALVIAALHLWGSHVIFFDMSKWKTTAFWEWTGPDGPSESPLVQVFDFPMVYFGEYTAMIGEWQMHFFILATINALLWGGAIGGVLMAAFHLLASRRSE